MTTRSETATTIPRAFGTRNSVVVDVCQSCGARDLQSIIFVGYLPPVNAMPRIGSRPEEQAAYPAELLRCPACELVQLGLIVDPQILFPAEYPYTSGTTKILREDFAELAQEASSTLGLSRGSFVIDIGSNDGTLLRSFQDLGYAVLGIEPTDQGRRAIAAGIPTTIAFFSSSVAREVIQHRGRASLITAANVFAHIEDVHSIIEATCELLGPRGVFVSESHYWLSLVEGLQYDTIYHEHLRYYSLTALRNLLAPHGLEVFHAKRIPTHGGSIRVYAARRGERQILPSVAGLIAAEESGLGPDQLRDFRNGVMKSKLGLLALLEKIRARGENVYGLGAPSRGSTLVNHVGLDEAIVECVLEIEGSQKIGKYLPGTRIPVVDEAILNTDPPAWVLLLSWHLADELVPKLRAKGYAGGFIIPLPAPRTIRAV